MKTEKELNELKEEYTGLSKKLSELTDDELKNVTGGKMNFNINPGALVALNQNNKHAEALAKTATQISTGVTINQGKDNPIEKHLEELKQRLEEENNQFCCF